jgi:hypothetical protein
MPSYIREYEDVDQLNPEFVMNFKAYFDESVKVQAVNANGKNIEISPKNNIDEKIGVVIHPDSSVSIDTGISFGDSKYHTLQIFASSEIIDKNLNLLSGVQLEVLDDEYKRIFIKISNKSTMTRWIYHGEVIGNGFMTKNKISNLITEVKKGAE